MVCVLVWFSVYAFIHWSCFVLHDFIPYRRNHEINWFCFFFISCGSANWSFGFSLVDPVSEWVRIRQKAKITTIVSGFFAFHRSKRRNLFESRLTSHRRYFSKIQIKNTQTILYLSLCKLIVFLIKKYGVFACKIRPKRILQLKTKRKWTVFEQFSSGFKNV